MEWRVHAQTPSTEDLLSFSDAVPPFRDFLPASAAQKIVFVLSI
jgi:hypothetical protein